MSHPPFDPNAYNGKLAQTANEAIYAIIFGQAHHVQDSATLTGVFGSPKIDNNPWWLQNFLDGYVGFVIGSGSCIALNSKNAQFLVTNGHKYWITNLSAKVKYQLDGTNQCIECPTCADLLLNWIPDGPGITD